MILKTTKVISTKGLTKDLLNNYSICTDGRYFCAGVLQNYLIFTSANK